MAHSKPLHNSIPFTAPPLIVYIFKLHALHFVLVLLMYPLLFSNFEVNSWISLLANDIVQSLNLLYFIIILGISILYRVPNIQI